MVEQGRLANLRSKILMVALAGVVCFSAFPGAAPAADTANVTVTATMTTVCQFNSNGTVTFTLDPTSAADAAGVVVQPVYWCTSGTTSTITDDNGLHETGTTHRMWDTATNSLFIPYTFTYTATGAGTGKSTPVTMNIAATVLNANFVGAAAGTYSDTVTLTVSP